MVTRIFNGDFFEDLEVDRDAMRLSQCTAELKGLGQAPAAPQRDRRFFSSKHMEFTSTYWEASNSLRFHQHGMFFRI
jgi:hypothetical protein